MANVFSSDLASTRYSTAAVTFAQYWSGQYTLADRNAANGGVGLHFDGDFTAASPVGHHLIEFPFAHEGDTVSQIVRQHFWQLAANFKPQALGTSAPSRTDLLLIDEENFRDEHAGIVSWDRVYATIPQPRDVWEDHGHGFQYMYGSGSTVKLSEQVFTVASRVRCEYFHVKDLGQWEILFALRVIQLTENGYSKRGTGSLFLQGNVFVSTDKQIVAEDSKLHLWKYPIMERRTRYIAGPTTEFWGRAISL